MWFRNGRRNVNEKDVKFQIHRKFMDLVRVSKADLVPGRQIVVKIKFSEEFITSEWAFVQVTDTGELEFIILDQQVLHHIHFEDIQSVLFVSYGSVLK